MDFIKPDKNNRTASHLTPEEVKFLAEGANVGKHGQINPLLILLLFQTSLRISEALDLTPSSIQNFNGKPVLSINRKEMEPRLVAYPEKLIEKLNTYISGRKINPTSPLFPIKRSRAWQIIKESSIRAKFGRKVYPQLLRHTGAIERLRQTQNPKALQIHLGHFSPVPTMKYLLTLIQEDEDAIKINQEVNFDT